MPVETDIERAVMLADFGQTATFTHGATTTTIRGIFDNDFINVDVGGGVGMAMQEPKFFAKTSDVTTAVEDDTLVTGGITYKIKVVQSDGTGMTLLVLEKQ